MSTVHNTNNNGRKHPTIRRSITRLIALAFGLAVLLSAQFMALPAAAAQSGATKPVSATVVAEYEQGEFLESVAFDRHGNMYVTSAFKGVIYKLAPDGTQTTFATFPVGEGDFGQQSGAVLTLVLDRGGIVYATVQHPDPTLHGVWRIAPDGTKAVVATLPLDAQPNGITIDRRGNLFVADSALGIIWRIERGTSEAKIWIEDDLLRPAGPAGFPGANGVKFYHNDLYASNSSTGNIVRISVQPDGSAGQVLVYATGVPTDDFAFDVLGNIYATTHPFNTVVKIGRDGTQTVIATPEQNVIGPTAAAFGVRGADRLNLYVVTDGGLFGQLIDPNSPAGPPSIVRLEVGVPGLPIR